MGEYFIKPGYVHRRVNASVEAEAGDYWTQKRIRESRNHQHAVYDEAARLIREHGLRTVLDVGCGMPTKLMEMLAPLARATGVDQATIVETALKRYGEADLVAVDLEQPDQPPDGTFDLVVCADVIEHLVDPDVLLRYILAHCHAGSWIVISTPERDVLRGYGNAMSPVEEHVREWNANELVSYLAASGLRVQRHMLVPAFRVASLGLAIERLRYVRHGKPMRSCQVAICRPYRIGVTKV